MIAPPYLIEPAGTAHALALAALHAATFPADESWDAAAFAGLLAAPGVLGFAHPQGMVLARVAADEAEILTIAVLSEGRRRGLGRTLIETAADACRSRGADEMFLEVSETNSPAQRLYAAAGFVAVGRRRSYYPDGSDALLLRRRLRPGAATDG